MTIDLQLNINNIKSSLQVQCDIDISIPIPDVDNVYLIKADKFNYKIGFSKTPLKRLKQLQTGNPYKLKLIACCPGSKQLEDKIHKYLSNKLSNSGSAKEWFKLNEQNINDIIFLMVIKYINYVQYDSREIIINSVKKNTKDENSSQSQFQPQMCQPYILVQNIFQPQMIPEVQQVPQVPNFDILPVYINTKDKDIKKNTKDKDITKNTQDKYISKNTQDKDIYKNTQDKYISKNTQDKDIYKNTQDKDIYKNTQDKDFYKNTTDKDISKNTQAQNYIMSLIDNKTLNSIKDINLIPIFNSFTCKELKSYIRDYNLTTKGNKNDLINTLINYYDSKDIKGKKEILYKLLLNYDINDVIIWINDIKNIDDINSQIKYINSFNIDYVKDFSSENFNINIKHLYNLIINYKKYIQEINLSYLELRRFLKFIKINNNGTKQILLERLFYYFASLNTV